MTTVAEDAARIDRIVRNLLRHVPPPPRAEARPTKSFATLRAGQHIREAGRDTVHVVVDTDSQGATLRPLEGGAAFRLEDREWKQQWSRVRKSRKTKGKTG